MQKRKRREADAHQRITAQNPQADKLARGHVLINNEGHVEETWKQVQDAWQQVRQAVIQQTAGAQTIPSMPKGAVEQAAAARAADPASQPESAAATPLDARDIRVEVKRGMPGNAEDIARFIATITGKAVSRMDIMLAFGQKSYLMAQDQHGNHISAIGWQVVNLITRTVEFYLKPGVPPEVVIGPLITAIE